MYIYIDITYVRFCNYAYAWSFFPLLPSSLMFVVLPSFSLFASDSSSLSASFLHSSALFPASSLSASSSLKILAWACVYSAIKRIKLDQLVRPDQIKKIICRHVCYMYLWPFLLVSSHFYAREWVSFLFP